MKPDGALEGREQYKQIFAEFFDAFPPIVPLEIEDLFAAQDRLVCRFRTLMRHAKDYFGIAATNREIVFVETHVQRLRDGKIVENVVSATNLEFEVLIAPALAPLILKWRPTGETNNETGFRWYFCSHAFSSAVSARG